MTEPTPLRGLPATGEPTHQELTEAIEREIAAGREASQRKAEPINISEAEAARDSLKQRIKIAHAAAVRDLEYAEQQIAAIDRAVAMQQLNREGLVAMRDEAKSRIVQCKFGMARFA